MPHGNPVDWEGNATANAEVVGGVESSPTKYFAFKIAKNERASKVAKNMAKAWNDRHGGATPSKNGRKHRVTLPRKVTRTWFASFSNGDVAIQDVPNASQVINIAGLKVNSPRR